MGLEETCVLLVTTLSQLGEGKLVSSSTFDRLHVPVTNATDVVLSQGLTKGKGLFFFPLRRASVKIPGFGEV